MKGCWSPLPKTSYLVVRNTSYFFLMCKHSINLFIGGWHTSYWMNLFSMLLFQIIASNPASPSLSLEENPGSGIPQILFLPTGPRVPTHTRELFSNNRVSRVKARPPLTSQCSKPKQVKMFFALRTSDYKWKIEFFFKL